MDTKKLRQKVLDLAIRGKLVPQDPNDEPASVLLERIYAEKQKLISEGKIKREKRSSFIFKGEDNSYYEKVVENGKETIVNIDDEIPFDIPESWAWCRFEDLGFFMGGHTPSMKEEENWNGDIVWVSPKDMKSTIISNSILKISKKGAEKLEKIPINAILMVVRSGILRHSFPIAIAHVSCTINQDIKAFSSFLSLYYQQFYQGRNYCK